MPYLSCPTCALTTYTAAKFATWDECPRCSSRLGGQAPDLLRLDLPQREQPAELAGTGTPSLRPITGWARYG